MSSNPLRSEGQSRYGWVVVAVSATVNSLAWSVRSTFAAFYVALLAEFAWAAQGGGGLGGFIGPFLGGWLFDVTGSYQIAFAVAALAIAASAVAAWIAAPRRAHVARRVPSRIGP